MAKESILKFLKKKMKRKLEEIFNNDILNDIFQSDSSTSEKSSSEKSQSDSSSSEKSQSDSSSSEKSQSDRCPICMEDLQNTNITITKCGHKFCHTCIDSHSCINNKCPLCRVNMGTKTKVKNLCNCHVIESVNLSIIDSNHHLNNLCKRLIKNVFRTINEHKEVLETVISDKSDKSDKSNKSDRNNKNTETNEEYMFSTSKILKKLSEIEEFKIKISKTFYQDILQYTINNSNNACMNLKSMYENQNETHNHH